MADDPTPGELRIMFDNMFALLGDIKSSMATKDFVNAKFDAYHDRMSRLEVDHKEWVHKSTEAHVALDKDSKARHAETQAELDAIDVKVHARIDKVKDELQVKLKEVTTKQETDQKEIKAVRNSRVTAWIGIGLTWLGGVVLWFIDRGHA